MRTKLFLAAGTAAVAAGLATTASAAGGGIAYSFLGKLSAAPSGGHVSITVEGGNRPALRALLGSSVAQTFAYGDKTEFLRWTGGAPKVVEAGDLQPGDYVRVNVRAPRGSSLDAIESTDAGLIGDHGTQLTRPDQPAYLFRGQVTAVGSSTVSLEVRGGNRRALRLLIGSSRAQTFAVGGSTIYLRWQGKVPTVIDLADLKAGDRVAIHVRAAAGSTLAQVEATPAARVGEHEPANQPA
ncbi:MAG TPA: hypothetical protein VH816_18470 [Gaiellaceae bacterium]|jgi:hypothetical protein